MALQHVRILLAVICLTTAGMSHQSHGQGYPRRPLLSRFRPQQQNTEPGRRQPYPAQIYGQPQGSQLVPGNPAYARPLYRGTSPIEQRSPYEGTRVQYHAAEVESAERNSSHGVRSSKTTLSRRDLRHIDELAVKLVDDAKEFQNEVDEHFVLVPHAEKLDADAHELARIAETLHDQLHDSTSGRADIKRLRRDTNQFIELIARMPRSIGLLDRHIQGPAARRGIAHMNEAYRDAHLTALAIDEYLPVDGKIVDRQAAKLTEYVKELHDEFHELFENYEISAHLEDDLEELERSAEHIHELAHNQGLQRINFAHLRRDVKDLRESSRHIESLFDRQSRIGVRKRDTVGFEHARDVITDLHAAAYLLEHMITKSERGIHGNIREGHTIPRRDAINSRHEHDHD